MNTRQRAQPTGTNRPTQTHPHPPHPRAKTLRTKGRGQTPGKHTASTIRPTTNPPTTTHQPPQPHHNNHTTTPHHNHTTTTPQHAPHHRPLGGHSGEDTPGPIPNPEAKTPSANGTAPNQTRKSRTPPRPHKRWLVPRTQIRGASHLSLPVLSHPEVALNRSSAVRCPGATGRPTGRPTKWLTGYLIGRPDARHSARIAPWAFRPCMAPSECVTIAT